MFGLLGGTGIQHRRVQLFEGMETGIDVRSQNVFVSQDAVNS